MEFTSPLFSRISVKLNSAGNPRGRLLDTSAGLVSTKRSFKATVSSGSSFNIWLQFWKKSQKIGENCKKNYIFLDTSRRPYKYQADLAGRAVSVARWPKFRPKRSKRARGKIKLAGRICGRILPKLAEKGLENIL
jgi:hypothetical protein